MLFRKVWRDKERFIQGMLLAQDLFTQGAIDRPFQQAALASMSEIIVAYQGDVLSSTTGGQSSRYRSGAGELDGALLYRARLTVPFDSLEVIYTIKQLPPGPGAPVLAWVSLVLGLVLCSGFYALYRMGLGQIRLARQQQDFVSAVSHELKTPLTSIRMYSEMLKELKGELPVGFVVLNSADDGGSDIKAELTQRVRQSIGPIACYRQTYLVARLPKTRSGKVLRKVLKAMLNDAQVAVPATIDDPSSLDDIKNVLSEA